MSIIEEIQTEYGYKKTIERTEETADQMFEELGYEKTFEDNTVIIYEAIESSVEIILCDKEFVKEDYGTATNITMQELKAINKKCEELGWI